MSSLEDQIEAVEQMAREDRVEREKAGKSWALSYEMAVARTAPAPRTALHPLIA